MAMSVYNFFSYICHLSLLLISSGKFSPSVSFGKFSPSVSFVENVCSQTHDQAFCMRVLGSDPRTRNANVYELEQISIDLASHSATDTKAKIHNLYLSANDPQLKQRLYMCDKFYADAIEALRGATDDLKKAQFLSVNLAGSDIDGDGRYCEEAFENLISPLTNENNYLQKFGEIIAVISNML